MRVDNTYACTLTVQGTGYTLTTQQEQYILFFFSYGLTNTI